MSAEQKYQETLEQLYFVTRDLTELQKKQEQTFIAVSELSALISTFHTSLDTLQGERKIKAINTIKTLQMVFSEIGSSYLMELYFRNKCFQYEKSIMEATKKIERLEKEINILTQIDELA
jgi:chromosome segregation ATPase